MKNLDIKIIVNADDYGKDERTTLAIAESFSKGYVNQTTLMVNMPWAEKAVELAKREGFADKIGLHLNLTEGLPLTEGMRKNRLYCGDDGFFNKGFCQARHLLRPYSGNERRCLRDEIAAQVEKYVSFGLPLMHCDSHHNIHFGMPLMLVLLPELRKRNFQSIRMTTTGSKNCKIGMGHKIRNIVSRSLFKAYGLDATDQFSDALSFEELKRGMSEGDSVELMVHPGYDSEGRLINILDYDSVTGVTMDEICRMGR